MYESARVQHDELLLKSQKISKKQPTEPVDQYATLSENSDFSLSINMNKFNVGNNSTNSREHSAASENRAGSASVKKAVSKTRSASKGKGKKNISLMQRTERNLIVLLARTYYLYNLIQECNNHFDLKSFFAFLSESIDQRSRFGKRVESTLFYLKQNSALPEEYVSVNERELGARLI